VVPVTPALPVDVSGSGSAEQPSASGSGSGSGDQIGASGVSSASGEGSGSGFQITFSGSGHMVSGEGSASGQPQEAGEGSGAVTYPGSGLESGSGASGLESGSGAFGSGSAEGPDGQQGTVFSGFSSGSGSASGSGDLSGSGDESFIIMVDGKLVDLSKTDQKHTEQEFGSGTIDYISGSGAMSGSGSMSGSGVMSGSGFFLESGMISGSGDMSGSTSGSGTSGLVSGSISGSGLPDVSFVQQDLVDLTEQPSGEQELSGSPPSGLPSGGFPSGGFSSGSSGSGLGSGTTSGEGSFAEGDVILLTDDGMMEMTMQPPLQRRPEQGRGVVEISGQGSGGVSGGGSGSESDSHLHFSGSGLPHEETTTQGFSIELAHGSTLNYPENPESSLDHSEGSQELEVEKEARAGPTEEVYTTYTAPSVVLATPGVVEPPAVVDGKHLFKISLICHLPVQYYKRILNLG